MSKDKNIGCRQKCARVRNAMMQYRKVQNSETQHGKIVKKYGRTSKITILAIIT